LFPAHSELIVFSVTNYVMMFKIIMTRNQSVLEPSGVCRGLISCFDPGSNTVNLTLCSTNHRIDDLTQKEHLVCAVKVIVP
jgi:hypothetical protein